MPPKLTDEGLFVSCPAPAGGVPPIPRRRQPPPTHCGASRRNGRDLIIATRSAHQPLPSLHQRQRRRDSFAPRRERFLCLRRPHFFQQRKKWGKERRQKLRFCTSSARYACSPLSVFPHVTGVFLIVVVPPTVPAQLSAAAARCYGKLFCSLVLRDNKHITPRARRAHLPIAVLRAAMGAI